ncbi:hypothetical protein M2155_001966 [Streptomyces sp. SAI-119]|nr:hypothetical protein [Streptomyces sp. SAI-119]
MDAERVGGGAVGAAQPGAALGVDDRKVQAELLCEFVAPLQGEARRTDHHDAVGTPSQQQLLDDEASLDGLAEADVIGEEQVDTGGADRAGDGFELVGLDGDAGAERRLEGLDVGGGDGRPADGVEERGETGRRVVLSGRRVGQGAAVEDAAAGLDFPDDGEGVPEAAVGDGLEVNEGGGAAVGGRGGFHPADDPALTPYFDELTVPG